MKNGIGKYKAHKNCHAVMIFLCSKPGPTKKTKKRGRAANKIYNKTTYCQTCQHWIFPCIQRWTFFPSWTHFIRPSRAIETFWLPSIISRMKPVESFPYHWEIVLLFILDMHFIKESANKNMKMINGIIEIFRKAFPTVSMLGTQASEDDIIDIWQTAIMFLLTYENINACWIFEVWMLKSCASWKW